MTFAPTFDVSCAGLCVVDILGRPVEFIPEGGSIAFLSEIRMTVAGTAAATAVDCGILGLRTRAVMAVGDDDLGDYVVSKMGRFGVNTELIARTAEAQTSTTILPVRPNGERPCLHTRGANAVFDVSPSIYDDALDAKVLHVGGTGLLSVFDGKSTLELLREAKSRGVITTFDLIHATPEVLALVEPCLPYIDYFVPSIEEAAGLSGLNTLPDIVDFFQSRGTRNVIVTLGDKGVYVQPENSVAFTIPAHEFPLVDTTGCGDSFTAGIIVGIIKGWDLHQSARFANAVAAQVAMGLGSVGKLTSFDTTAELVETLPLKRSSSPASDVVSD